MDAQIVAAVITGILGIVGAVAAARIALRKSTPPAAPTQANQDQSKAPVLKLPDKDHTPPRLAAAELNSDAIDKHFTTILEIHGPKIEKVTFGQNDYILKRSILNSVDIDALNALKGIQISESWGHVHFRLLTPSNLIVKGDRVLELNEYYSGNRLDKIIVGNKYKMQGEYLAAVYQCGLLCLRKLHAYNILHRDFSPQNMLIDNNGNIIHLDITSCCYPENQTRVSPIYNLEFSAPEQRALCASLPNSDLFSFASSIFYLAFGRSPKYYRKEDALQSKLCEINTSGLVSKKDLPLSKVLGELLHETAENRAHDYVDLGLGSVTVVVNDVLLGIIDLFSDNYLCLCLQDYFIGDRSSAIQELNKRIKSGMKADQELLADVETFRGGGNPWRVNVS